MYREIVNALVRHFDVLRRVPAYAGDGTVLARTIAIDRDGRPLLHRVVMLTPYGIETLIEDGKRAGRAGQLRVALPLEAPAAVAACIGTVVDRLQVAGVRVSIVRERRASGSDDEPVSDGCRRPGAEDFVRLVPFLPLARSTLHELQKERLLTAYLAALANVTAVPSGSRHRRGKPIAPPRGSGCTWPLIGTPFPTLRSPTSTTRHACSARSTPSDRVQ